MATTGQMPRDDKDSSNLTGGNNKAGTKKIEDPEGPTRHSPGQTPSDDRDS